MTDYNLGTVVGNGIVSIEKTGTSGLVDTYTITFSNGATTTFTVTNGKDGQGGADINTSWGNPVSDEKLASEKLTKDTLDTKVNIESGKGLSSNDFTDTLKNKLDGIAAQANKYVHPSNKQCNYTYTHPTSKQCNATIPTKTSDLTNDGDGTTGVTYVKSNDSRLTDSRTPTSHTHGDISNDGKLGSTANLPLITTTNGKITVGSFGNAANTFCEGNDSRLSDARTPTTHDQATSTITNSTAFDNILSGESTTLTLTDQAKINSAINTVIGTLKGIQFIVVTSDKGTASADTMNKLYIVSENSKVNVYYTKQSGSSYSWQKMDTDILDELSIAWSDITSKPDSFTPSSHTHGNLTNDGKVGTASGKIITTTTGGAIQASDSITKSLISDFPSTMTPSSHTHGNLTNDGKIGSTSGLPVITTTGGVVTVGSFGTSSGTFAEGNHSHTGYLTGSDIADNLTTNDSTKVLSAKQGKVLKDLIGDAITYINQ